MKPKRYLVFGWETTFRMGNRKGGWNDLLDSFDKLEEAVDHGKKYLYADPVRHPEVPRVFQIVDLSTGMEMTVRDGESCKEDCARLLKTMKPHDMDRPDGWNLH